MKLSHLNESTISQNELKSIYNGLSKGNELNITYKESSVSTVTKRFKVIKGKTIVGKSGVERITLINVDKPNSAKYYFYNRNNNISFAHSDMPATIINIAENTIVKNDISEDENPCWDGYEMVGMKEKDGKEVPNCVPKNEMKESVSVKLDRRGNDTGDLVVKHNGVDYIVSYTADTAFGNYNNPYAVSTEDGEIGGFLTRSKEARVLWKTLKPMVDKYLKSKNEMKESVNPKYFPSADTNDKSVWLLIGDKFDMILKNSKYSDVGSYYYVYDKNGNFIGSANSVKQGTAGYKKIRLSTNDIKAANSITDLKMKFESKMNETEYATNPKVGLKDGKTGLDFKTQRAAYNKLQSSGAIIFVNTERDNNFYKDVDYVKGLELFSKAKSRNLQWIRETYTGTAGDKLTHRYNPKIEIELIEPTNRGWKVYQIERGKKKIAYFDKQDIVGKNSLFEIKNSSCGCNTNKSNTNESIDITKYSLSEFVIKNESLGHAEVVRAEKFLSSEKKAELSQKIKNGEIKTSNELKSFLGKSNEVSEGISITKIQKDLTDVVSDIKIALDKYKSVKGTADEKKWVDELKKLNVLKKKYQSELDKGVQSLYADAEFDG
jgi:hypothetical protein